MPVKTTISEKDFPKILSNYDVGKYKGFKTFANGAGQTTVLLLTTKGKFVLRYYENRPEKHVLFEVKLFNYLQNKKYPVPSIIKNNSKELYSIYNEKPYMIIEFIDGKHSKDPNDFFSKKESSKIIKAVAQLHKLTKKYNPKYFQSREVFDVKYCWKEYKAITRTKNKKAREIWLKNQLANLILPKNLTKGLCHADLNYGNFLLKNNKVVAVLDFDMSFYFYTIYDVASLIYWWAWPPEKGMKKQETTHIVNEYLKYNKLSKIDRAHIYDALKLIILLGISWSEEEDYENEKKKIEFLDSLGRDVFYNMIFK